MRASEMLSKGPTLHEWTLANGNIVDWWEAFTMTF